MKLDNCPICNSDIKLWRKKETEAGLFEIDLCSSCGFAFVNPRPSLNFLMEFYSVQGIDQKTNGIITLASVIEQEKNYPNSTVDAKRMIDNLLKFVNQSKGGEGYKLLDVGCGYGFFSREAIKNGFNVTALEIASEDRKIATEMTGLIPIAKSFEDFKYDGQLYDVILMSQILEHAFDVNLWIKKAYNILKPNGLILIALPNYSSIFRKILQSNDPYISPPAHLNFFNRNSLSLLLSNSGFEIIHVEYISRIPKDSIEKKLRKFGKQISHLISNSVPIMLNGIDLLRLGMIINIYARKI
jgi:2-polyprenyl-3-methyl-5-hydroxy-6-metoxy-1,4-benzoquinol methylase